MTQEDDAIKIKNVIKMQNGAFGKFFCRGDAYSHQHSKNGSGMITLLIESISNTMNSSTSVKAGSGETDLIYLFFYSTFNTDINEFIVYMNSVFLFANPVLLMKVEL